jgi:ubiquinone/menaquinone biosynthesis C-methylase UbiE
VWLELLDCGLERFGLEMEMNVEDGSKLGRVDLKRTAIEYFDAKSDLWAERYAVPASGDLLWMRHRAILETILEMQIPRTARILDLGCGSGFLDLDLANLGYSGMGIDAAPSMIGRCALQAATKGISDSWQYQVGDVEALPFRDASFDVAICAGVIEYLSGDEELLNEVLRILKPGGLFILCVTNKYGYTASLSSIFYRVKKVPGVKRVASLLRKLFVGGELGAMEFTAIPRKHRPSTIQKLMADRGFQIEKDKYVQFTLLPSPFCAVFSRLKTNLDEKLNALDHTRLRIFGSSYLLAGRRTGRTAS